MRVMGRILSDCRALGLWSLTFVGLLFAPQVWAQRLRQATATDSLVAFVNVAVIPMDRERVLVGQTVVVQGTKIIALGPQDRVQIPARAVRIDGRGKFLLPGLADMHVHFGKMRSRGIAKGIDWVLDTSQAKLADILFVYLANGITTVRDMHSGRVDPWFLTLRHQVATGELLGPHLYGAGDPDESSPEAAAKSIAELKAAGYDFAKLYGRPRPLYDSIVMPARRLGLRVVGHIPSPADVGLENLIQDQWASFEHVADYRSLLVTPMPLAMHPLTGAEQPDMAKVRRLAAATPRIWVCPTLSVSWGFDSVNQRLTKALYDAGVGTLLGTDASVNSPLLTPGFVIHEELAKLVAAGLTPYQALETGTRNVAEFLGTLDSAGTVAVGKRADLVLLAANPLEDIHRTGAITGVMIGGRWLPRAELERRLDAVPLTGDSTSFPARIRHMRDRLWH